MKWNKLQPIAAERVRKAQAQIVHAGQLAAAVGHSLAEPKADDSHTAMTWRHAEGMLCGAVLPTPFSFYTALTVSTLTLSLHTADGLMIAGFSLNGKTREEGLSWLNREIARIAPGMPAIHLIEYDYDPLPEHPVARGLPFQTEDHLAFAQSAVYLHNAQLLLEKIVEVTEGASPILLWPHHFDIAAELPAPQPEQPAGTIGVGMCTPDNTISAPYWYVAAYPYLKSPQLPPITAPGRWQTEKWVGAVLTVEEGIRADEQEEQATAEQFLSEAIDAIRRAVAANKNQ